MGRPKFETVDDYINSFPETERNDLNAIRAAIRAGAPGAQEVISYGIPAYKLNGWLYYFSAYTNHYSLSSPPPNRVWDAFADRLKSYKRSLSALQFPKDQPLPIALITEMAAAKAKENTGAPA
jgi:uncharacterized protein YdhG (YjbR/CyaY superfamily)